MSLSDLASLGSFVSGVAVLGSLVFLFFQMRQMTEQVTQTEKNQQAAIRQGRAAVLVDMNLRMAEGLYDFYLPLVRGQEATSLDHVRRFLVTALSLFTLYHEEFEQHQEGLTSDRAFASFTHSMLANMRAPGLRVAWKFFRDRYDDQFQAFIDKLIADTIGTGGSLLSQVTLERWNADVSAESARVASGI